MPKASAVHCNYEDAGPGGVEPVDIQTLRKLQIVSPTALLESSGILEEFCSVTQWCLFLDFKDAQQNSRSLPEASAFLVCPEQETPSFLTLL